MQSQNSFTVLVPLHRAITTYSFPSSVQSQVFFHCAITNFFLYLRLHCTNMSYFPQVLLLFTVQCPLNSIVGPGKSNALIALQRVVVRHPLIFLVCLNWDPIIVGPLATAQYAHALRRHCYCRPYSKKADFYKSSSPYNTFKTLLQQAFFTNVHLQSSFPQSSP